MERVVEIFLLAGTMTLLRFVLLVDAVDSL